MDRIQMAVIRKKIEGELVDLMVKTRTDNVYLADNETTLAAHLSTMLDGYATREQVQQAIDALVDDAPEALNTLKEIADWIDAHGDEYEALEAMVSGKVDQVPGKGLSTEDFTTALKEKLEGLSELPSSISAETVMETADRQFVTTEERSKIAASARVLVGSTTPEGLTAEDLFFQIVE